VTEKEWLECAEPEVMLKFVESKATERQLRLFICACVRQVWNHLDHETSERAVELAEQFSDGGVSEEVLGRAAWAALCAADHVDLLPTTFNARHAAMYAPTSHPNIEYALSASWYVALVTPGGCSEKEQAEILRDLIPHPFRPVTCDPAWRTSTVLALAQGIYDERAFDRMPILADALQDAGCDSADILDHCRGPGPHVRGCWVVDLILSKDR
jgi:hypothetical protein